METVTVAAVQAAPVWLALDDTIERVGELADKAAGEGAGLVVFPETFVPGYPEWVWRTPPWDGHAAELFARLLDQAVVVGSSTTDALGAIARRLGIWLAVSVDEREEHGATLYNTTLLFGSDGELASRHRKLVPTGPERLVWGTGDGSTLTVTDTPFGRVGGLVCWENYMPLARAALYAQGVDLWLAPTWDDSDAFVATMRHIAREGRVYVVGVNTCMRASDVPLDTPGRDELYAGGDEDWMSRGRSVIVDPAGDVLAGPVTDAEEILYAEVDAGRARASRHQFDAVGHYSGGGVFRLTVDTRPHAPVSLDAVPTPPAPPPSPES
jgi:nitrilase